LAWGCARSPVAEENRRSSAGRTTSASCRDVSAAAMPLPGGHARAPKRSARSAGIPPQDSHRSCAYRRVAGRRDRCGVISAPAGATSACGDARRARLLRQHGVALCRQQQAAAKGAPDELRRIVARAAAPAEELVALCSSRTWWFCPLSRRLSGVRWGGEWSGVAGQGVASYAGPRQRPAAVLMRGACLLAGWLAGRLGRFV
jgi:hypothetical protein